MDLFHILNKTLCVPISYKHFDTHRTEGTRRGSMLRSGSIILKLLLLFTLPSLLIQCASAPKMATVEKDGETVDIVFINSFLTTRMVKQVKLAPDKSNLMVVFSDDSVVYIDSMNGIDENPTNVSVLNQKNDFFCSKGPSFYSDQSAVYFNRQLDTPDKKYSFQLFNYALAIRSNGELIPFGHSETMDIWPIAAYYTTNSRVAVLSKWDNQLLEIFDIKTNKVLCSAEIPSTDGTNFKQYSMSADEKGEKLFVHSCYFIQLFDMKTAKHLANLIFTDKKNWILVTDSGKYDGTTDAVKQLAWKVGKEEIPLINFGPSFYVKGLLGSLLGYSRADVAEKETPVESQDNQLDMKKQLIGKVHKVGPNDVIISIGLSKKSLAIGDKLFVLINGKKTILEVTYPMMASAKCKIKQGDKNVTEGLPVFTEKK